jgi:hypothetical protein
MLRRFRREHGHQRSQLVVPTIGFDLLFYPADLTLENRLRPLILQAPK